MIDEVEDEETPWTEGEWDAETLAAATTLPPPASTVARALPPPPSIPPTLSRPLGVQLTLDESDRQLVLLALAVLSVRSPGADDALNRIALRIDNDRGGRGDTYDSFRRLNLCAFCKAKPLAYPGAVYCGGACSARAEAKEAPP